MQWPDAPLFSYAYNGGSPPPTREALLIFPDQTGQYLAGHTWPRHPPFDEIGIYQKTFSAEQWRKVQEVLETTSASIDDSARKFGEADGVFETLTITSPGVARQQSWGADQPPDRFRPLLEKIYRLIDYLREHPFSTLRAELEFDANARSNDQSPFRFRLTNRGILPFEIDGQEADAIQARILFRSAEEIRESSSPRRSPIQLLRVPPARTLVEERKIAAGSSQLISVLDSETLLPPLNQRGTIYSLLRVFWRIAGLEHRTPVQEGWLMPEPCEKPSNG